MIVLDEVDAARRKPPRQRRKLLRRQPLRLQRRAGERASARAAFRAQPRDADIRAAEARRHRVRDFGVVEGHILLHRRIAEQHVEQLPASKPGRLHREPDPHLEQPGLKLANALHLAHDVAEHRLVRNGRERRLDALLDRDGLARAPRWRRRRCERDR